MLNDYKNHVYNPFMPGIITHPHSHSHCQSLTQSPTPVQGGLRWGDWTPDGRDVGMLAKNPERQHLFTPRIIELSDLGPPDLQLATRHEKWLGRGRGRGRGHGSCKRAVQLDLRQERVVGSRGGARSSSRQEWAAGQLGGWAAKTAHRMFGIGSR